PSRARTPPSDACRRTAREGRRSRIREPDAIEEVEEVACARGPKPRRHATCLERDVDVLLNRQPGKQREALKHDGDKRTPRYVTAPEPYRLRGVSRITPLSRTAFPQQP